MEKFQEPQSGRDEGDTLHDFLDEQIAI